MTPTFTPNNETLKRMKVLESPYLIAILKKMEEGAAIVVSSFERNKTSRLSYRMSEITGKPSYYAFRTVSIRNLRTLETAGLIAPTEYEDYIEYNLTYTCTFDELVRNADNQNSK